MMTYQEFRAWVQELWRTQDMHGSVIHNMYRGYMRNPRMFVKSSLNQAYGRWV